jgi:hypothetical protein
MNTNEQGGFGDQASIVLNAGAQANETVGIEGFYKVECHDASGNLKWEDSFPNLVNAVGKELMLDTLLKGTSYSVTGPFLGLISGASPTFGTGSDTMTSHAGWTEFVNYTVGGSAVRGTAVFCISNINWINTIKRNYICSSSYYLHYYRCWRYSRWMFLSDRYRCYHLHKVILVVCCTQQVHLLQLKLQQLVIQ